MTLANMGVKYSEHWGTWDVNYCYYGVLDSDGSYQTFNKQTGKKVVLHPKARWSVESLVPNTKATADALWAQREAVTDLVAAQGNGGEPKLPEGLHPAFVMMAKAWDAQTGGIASVRLRVEDKGDRWVISEYDYGRWTAVLPK